MESVNFSSPCGSLPAEQLGSDGQTPAHSNTAAKTPMSASLRERLKKTRRSFNSPFILPKRLKIDCQGEGGGSADPGTDASNSQLPGEACSAQAGVTTQTENLFNKLADEQPETGAEGEGLGPHFAAIRNAQTPAKFPRVYPLSLIPEQQQLLEEKVRLQREVSKKEELLRRLKMVQMYREKNNLAQLGSLIEKWRKSSQTLLYELQVALSTDSKPTLTQLIDSLAVEDRLLHYNRLEEDFTDA
ncbi:swi5-dependent recombination DNA repair protein 1 homolog [Heterodontus francisci]|uniref:swi5-dependent recombination DNA repair protein 1 homolog n=1 Tax=Heterodontus francisci TaxID=7792 RepID=UPI00355B503C